LNFTIILAFKNIYLKNSSLKSIKNIYTFIS